MKPHRWSLRLVGVLAVATALWVGAAWLLDRSLQARARRAADAAAPPAGLAICPRRRGSRWANLPAVAGADYPEGRGRVHVHAAGIEIEGVSIAGHESFYKVPAFRTLLEFGRAPEDVVGYANVCVTHGHLDH